MVQDGLSAPPPIVFEQDTSVQQDTREGCPYILCTGGFLFIVNVSINFRKYRSYTAQNEQ